MIQSLSHIQRSRRLSQDFDDYLERTSRSSIHSSSSDIISPQYNYAHQHQAKLEAYQQSQMRRGMHEFEELMHNAPSGPNNKHKPIIAQNKLIGNLNAMKQVPFSAEPSDLSDGNTSFMDEMSSDSDLEDEEKLQYHNKRNCNKRQVPVVKRQYPQLIHQLPKVPKPRNLNLNAHRHKYLRHPSVTSQEHKSNEPNVSYPMHINISSINMNRHERADSNSSAMSSSIVSSVCTPHQNDHNECEDDEKAHRFFGKHQIPRSNASNVSKMSNLLGPTIQSLQSDASAYSMHSMQSVPSMHSIPSICMHINIKIFESSHDMSCELWMNIGQNDTVDDVISAIINQYKETGKPLKGTQPMHYQLRYYDEDEEEIDEDLPPLGRKECVASKQIDSIAMLFIDNCCNHNDNDSNQNDNDEIPEIDWDYTEYQVKDEYSRTKTKCILGIGRDRIHIVIKSNKTTFNNYNSNGSYMDLMPRRRMSTNGSISGSLMPHFTYVFRLAAPSNRRRTHSLYQHRWIDARVLMRQKHCRLNLHQDEEEVNRARQNAICTTDSRDRSIATTFHTAVPKLGLMLQTSVPTNGVLQNMQQLQLKPLRSGLLLDEYTSSKGKQPQKLKKKNRRNSSAWSFNLNLFGLLKQKKKPDALHVDTLKLQNHTRSTSTVCTDDTDGINYESWNTYNKDGRYFDKKDLQEKISPSLRGHYRSGSGSVASFLSSRNRKSSVASNLSSISINNDEFTPLTIELCQKISVLKRDNKVFEINFLLDLSSQTPSSQQRQHSHSNSLLNMNHNRTPSKTYWGPRSKRKSKIISAAAAAVDDVHEFSQQSSTRSLSIQSANGTDKKAQFQPYQADNIEIWTDVSQSQSHSQSNSHSHSHSHSQSPSRSSTMELIDIGDYKPTDYKTHWNPTQIIPKLEQISASQHNNNDNSAPQNNKNAFHKTNIHHPNSLVKQLVNKAKFHVFGNDKYLTHTVRYCAKSPEDCCQIVRKIQHLMLLENKAMDH